MNRQDRIDAEIDACTECGGLGFPKRSDCDGCIAKVDEDIAAEKAAESIAQGALVIIRTSLPVLIAADTTDILGKLKAELDGFEPDTTTKKGRELIATMAMKPRRAKAAYERIAKSLKEDAQATIKSVNAENNQMVELLDGLAVNLRRPLDEIEAAEAAVRKENADALFFLQSLADGLDDLTAAEIGARAENIQPFPWSLEYKMQGENAQAGVVARLQVAHTAAIQREHAAAAAMVREAEEAERIRIALLRQQAEREAQIAAQAAEQAKAAAEREAERKAVEAERKAQRADYHRRMLQHVKNCGLGFIDDQPQPIGILQRELNEKIAYDEENFGDLLAEALVARDEALGRLQASVDRARKTQEEADRAETARLRDEAAVKMAEARAAQAETARLAAIVQAQKGAEELAAKVERERVAAAAMAAKRQAEAVAAEQRRVADAKAEEERLAAARAANIQHKKKVNGEALADILKAISPLYAEDYAEDISQEDIAKAIVVALAKSEIRHCKIEY
jgi:hypothetical protein